MLMKHIRISVFFSQIPVVKNDSEADLSKLFKNLNLWIPAVFFLSLFCNAFDLEKSKHRAVAA